MVNHRPRFAARLSFVALFLTGSLLASTAAVSQTLPNLRTTFVARSPGEPNPCGPVACFERAAYDRNMLAAIGNTFPAVYVYARIPAGPWYKLATLQNRRPLQPGYTAAGYKYPVAVMGDDIVVTALQSGPGLTPACETHVLARTGTGTAWTLKQVIPVCAAHFATDNNRLWFGTATGPMPIYLRDSVGVFAAESSITPPSNVGFIGTVSLALHNWTAVIGTPTYPIQAGAAHIYQRRGGEWTLTTSLVGHAAPVGSNQAFGASVAASDFTVAIGAPGAPVAGGKRGMVYIFTGVHDNWFISQEIFQPGNGEYNFGTKLALQGRRLLISSSSSAPNTLAPGYLYERGLQDPDWFARATMAGSGLSVSLSGSTAFVDVLAERENVDFGSAPTIVNLPALLEPDEL
jgi:hypothetical protein